MTMDRSAAGPTAVVAVSVLLAGSGSGTARLAVSATAAGIALLTVAVLTRMTVLAGAVTAIVMMGAVTVAASEGRVHVTEMLATLVHVQPVPAAETNVTPAGSVSLTDRLVALDGPRFDTLSW